MRVFIVEDEAEIREFLVSQFQQVGCEACGWPNGEGVIPELEKFKPNLILLDQRMPGKNGKEVLVEIRRDVNFCECPVMIVTGYDSEDEKVAAFEAGADDYVTKPFSAREVIARAKALVRRTQSDELSSPNILESKGLKVDFKVHKITLQGEELALTLTEFRIIVALLKNRGEVLTRDNLRATALGHVNVSDRTIDVHMAAIRRKLGTVGDRIETVRGVGYRIVV